MKKFVIITLATVVCLFSSLYLKAQDSQKIFVGVGAKYASEIDNVGLEIKGDYLFNETWEGSVGYTHFFEKDYLTFSMFDLNAHYVFNRDEKRAFYALAGLNILSSKFDMVIAGIDHGGTSNHTGFNLGAGGRQFVSESIAIGAEVKYVFSEHNIFTAGIAILYNF